MPRGGRRPGSGPKHRVDPDEFSYAVFNIVSRIRRRYLNVRAARAWRAYKAGFDASDAVAEVQNDMQNWSLERRKAAFELPRSVSGEDQDEIAHLQEQLASEDEKQGRPLGGTHVLKPANIYGLRRRAFCLAAAVLTRRFGKCVSYRMVEREWKAWEAVLAASAD